MSISRPTFSVVLDTRREKSDHTYPLKLRVTYNRIRKYYSTDLDDLSEDEFNKLSSTSLKNNRLRDIKQRIGDYLSRAEEVYKEMDVFSFRDFEKRYFRKYEPSVQKTIFFMFETYIDLLFQQGSISTSTVYSCTLNSLKSFRSRLTFEDITPGFLNQYETWMLKNGRSITTVSMYLRALRTIYNQSIEEGVVSKENYPFKKGKYQIPAGRNVKKAITLKEIEKIFNYPCEPFSSIDKAKDLWIFSYLCNGMNIKDICRIRYRDIDGDKLIFIRSKTQRTAKSNQKPIIIYLTDHAKPIINKWGQKPVLSSKYVFPILPNDVTSLRERELVQLITKLVNKYMKRIGEELGITKPITTYTARHSFSTVLKRSGVSVEYISESLGHSSLKTTENYLDAFEDDVKKKYSDLLMNF